MTASMVVTGQEGVDGTTLGAGVPRCSQLRLMEETYME
jgi:hypothetical protein